MLIAMLSWILTGAPIPHWPLELVAAQGYLESRYEPTAESRAKGGRWCGIWQTPARTDAECRALRNPFIAARAYRAQITAWMRFTRGDVKRALRGLGCGVIASRPGGQCRSYDVRALRLATRIRLAWTHWQVDRAIRGAT